MDKSEVLKSVEKLFSGSRIKRCRVYPYRNSRIFVISLLHNGDQQRIVVKSSNYHNPEHVSSEFGNLTNFSRGCNDPRISAPEPLYVDSEKGFFIMSYIDGTNLSYLLHHLRPASWDYLKDSVELSAVALARFHSIFSMPGEEVSIDGTVREDDINQCIKENAGRISQCNLNLIVKPFFDFSSWNIMMDKGKGSKLYLIDFPKTNYVFTPHLDLGRFRFGFELIKQYPPAKIFGMNLWDVDSLYDIFLKRYCEEMGLSPNENDLQLISCFTRANIKRSQDLSRKDKYSWQSRIERLYLQTFSKSWLEQ